MPDSLPFVVGTQGGTYLIVHARFKGLEPGNPDDFKDPVNPRSKFTAILFDGTEVTRECPSTKGYEPSAEEGYFERESYWNLEFLPFEVGRKAFGTEAKLIVEVLDAYGRYARDEKDVFVRQPDGWADAGVPPDAALPDAGPPDGGAPDAAE